MKKLLATASGLGLLAAGYALMAQTKAAKPIRVDVAQEKAGAEPTQFIPIVGYWVVAAEGTKNVLMVDGRKWKKGEPSAGLVDKARAIYGSRHEEFIDNVKAWAYFPIAVAQGDRKSTRLNSS